MSGKERYKKQLAALENFYKSRAAEPEAFLEQDISFIKHDLQSDIELSIGNISDALGRISVHHAISGVAALLRNDKGGWHGIHRSMLYSFWSIRLKEAWLAKM